MKFFTLACLLLALLGDSLGRKPNCLLDNSVDGDGIAHCLAYFPSWSYNRHDNECVFFIYGGCGGNENRFTSKDNCERDCKVVPYLNK